MTETLEQIIRQRLGAGKTGEQILAELRTTPPWSMFSAKILRAVVDNVTGNRQRVSYVFISAAKHALDRLMSHRKACEVCDVALEAMSPAFEPCPIGVVRRRQHVKAIGILSLEFERAGISLAGLFAEFVRRKKSS